MRRDALYKARKEAAKFIARADVLLAETDAYAVYVYNDPKQRGAVRRQSMELTRALAEFRRSKL